MLTVLNDWLPPFTWANANTRPCVGRTEPVESGIQSTGLSADVERPVARTLVLHHCSDVAVLLGTAPELGITPGTKIAKLLHLVMVVLHVIFHWQSNGIVNANVAT